jgi:hypothetical protein
MASKFNEAPSSRASRAGLSTTPPELFGFADQPCGDRVTEAGLKALAEYEERNGEAVVEEVALPDEVAEALETEAWQDRRQQHREDARERGHRLLTVCGKWRGGRRIPDIRLTGLWLRNAGFDLGQSIEVEVEAGALTIRAL